ncbi:MAG: hypothetical protein EZS28_003330 [Streblomastix strix]|uniref:Uncharacterized protein n=1 Tax=Streblomastix strix TaxID=222440 RepID=A0A5J4X316_9EUKA|nr:MAG: hypothetical protein EZS28_003330 [Streblomastix strix]
MKLTPQGQLQADAQVINQGLTRQTHFRGYFATNDEILPLQSSAVGNYVYSIEDLLVWVYEDNWAETDQIVPDQVTSASDNTPLEDSAEGDAGISNDQARRDHKHPIQVSSVLQAKDTATGEKRVATTYARSDHTHHVNLSNGVPLKDTGTGTADTSNLYASATHQHPLNVDPTVANVLLVNATAADNGSKTKYIKTGGTDNEILLGVWTIKKGVLAKFKIDTRSVFGKIQFNYHWTQEIGIDNYQYQFIPSLSSEGYVDRGLQISADGNTLTFNGFVIAGAGATNGSVNYSQGNAILWDVSSVGAEGGFYSNGTNVFWRAQTLQFDQFYQEQ